MITFQLPAVKLAQTGMGVDEIARTLNLTRASVNTYLSVARAWGMEVPGRQKAGRFTRIDLSHPDRVALTAAAEARGLTMAELASKLIAAVVQGGLVDAVLDDGDD